MFLDCTWRAEIRTCNRFHISPVLLIRPKYSLAHCKRACRLWRVNGICIHGLMIWDNLRATFYGVYAWKHWPQKHFKGQNEDRLKTSLATLDDQNRYSAVPPNGCTMLQIYKLWWWQHGLHQRSDLTTVAPFSAIPTAVDISTSVKCRLVLAFAMSKLSI